jgi:hypothetical protein
MKRNNWPKKTKKQDRLLSYSEAESVPQFNEALAGLPIYVLSNILSKCCSEGQRRAEEGAGSWPSSNMIPISYFWEMEILGVPLELHYYVRSPSRICLRRKDEVWSIAFSSMIGRFGIPNQPYVVLEVDPAIIPESENDLRRAVGLPMPEEKKQIKVFSFKRKGSRAQFRRDMSVIRLAI